MVGIQQERSKTLKKGEPDDHFAAVVKTALFLNKYKRDESWIIDINFPVSYSPEFVKQMWPRKTSRTCFGHIFDLCIRDYHFKPLAFIEMNGEVGYWFDGKKSKRHWKIANPTKHSKKLQQINDGINESYAESIGAEYIVLLKEEINGDAKDPDREKNSFQELQRGLRDWIK